jgi:hypothetical protein
MVLCDKIGVLGFSAGGSLSARAATSLTAVTLDESEPVDALSSRPDFVMLIYPAYLDLGENRSITPELHVTPETPPFFIFGTADHNHGNSSLVMAEYFRGKCKSVSSMLLA